MIRDVKGYEGLYRVTDIGDVCRGKKKTAGGFHWEYAEINTRRTEG